MILYAFLLFAIGGGIVLLWSIIKGTIDFIREPKPPKYYNHQQRKAYYIDREWELGEEEEEEEEEEEREINQYAVDKLNAYNAQLETYYRIINDIGTQINDTLDYNQKLKLQKHQADIMVKAANIAERAYKLAEKEGLD